MKAGKKLFIFPEGTRLKDESAVLGDIKSGLALIAIKTKTPIVPMWVVSKPKAFRKSKIIIGEPYELSDFYGKKLDDIALEEANEIVKDKMLQLKYDYDKKL